MKDLIALAFGSLIVTVSDAVKSRKPEIDDKFLRVRDENFSVLDGQSGVWAQEAENDYCRVDVGLTSYREAYGIFSEDLDRAVQYAMDSLQVKYKDLFAQVGCSPQNENRIQCDPDSNVGANLGDTADKADLFRSDTDVFASRASELDNECGERDTIIGSLNDMSRFISAQVNACHDMQDKWNSLSQAVKEFDGTYSSKFSGDFVSQQIADQARHETAQAIIQHSFFDVDAAADGDIRTNYTDKENSIEATIDDDGKVKIGGDFVRDHHLVNAQGEVQAGMTILGLRSQASASGEVDVGAGVEGEFGTNGFGVYGEGSAHAEAKASGDLGQDIGVNLPFGGFGTNLHGDIEGGASASGSMQAGYNPSDGSFGVGAHGDAYAGARANGSATVRGGPLSVTASASALAGAGAAADAGVTYQDGKVNVDLSADAALGLGFGGGVSASIDVRSIAQEGVNFVNKLIP